MSHKIYQVDAFSKVPFKGNPAAVMVLEQFLPDDLMQAIAMENNLAETAFVVPREKAGHFNLRWFTPTLEADFCGHATLATSHILRTEYGFEPPFHFHVIIGELIVDAKDGLYHMDAPITELEPAEITRAMRRTFKGKISEAYWAHNNLMLVMENPDDIKADDPDMAKILPLSEDGVIITAEGGGYDFISRYFAPKAGIPEDPVTGSAHAASAPYWAGRLGKNTLHAYQASKRGGELFIDVGETRLTISGHAVTFLKGEIAL